MQFIPVDCYIQERESIPKHITANYISYFSIMSLTCFTGIYWDNFPQFKVFHYFVVVVCLFFFFYFVSFLFCLWGFCLWVFASHVFLVLHPLHFLTFTFSLSFSRNTFYLLFSLILIHLKCFSWFISLKKSSLISIQPKHIIPHVYVNMTVFFPRTPPTGTASKTYKEMFMSVLGL